MAFPNHFLRRAVLLCAVLLLLRPPVRAVPSAGEEAAHTYAPPAHTVVGYYAGWSAYQGYQASDLPVRLLTHINYAFAGIDPKAVWEIKQIIGRLSRRGIGILLTDHNVRDALSITTCAHIISEGRIIVSGTSRELIDDPVAQEIYFGHEFTRDGL